MKKKLNHVTLAGEEHTHWMASPQLLANSIAVFWIYQRFSLFTHNNPNNVSISVIMYVRKLL